MISWHRRGVGEEIVSSLLDSPCGLWSVRWVPQGICEIISEKPSRKDPFGSGILPIWLEKAWEQFWQGKRPMVTFSIDRPIPEFTCRVYEIVSEIPVGETMTYAKVAEAAGNIRAARAVGSVMRNNPWALFIPCHRVIGSDGSMTGYGGPKGIPLKKRILAHEKKIQKPTWGA
mgnify:CR=1 FL=1